MDIRRIALIVDNRSQSGNLGVHCLRALESLVEVSHILPSEMAQVPRRGFDLYLCLGDFLECQELRELRPAAWWISDSYSDYDRCRLAAQQFDYVFSAQRLQAERLHRDGIEATAWLPHACDPEIHRRHLGPKNADVCLADTDSSEPQKELLQLLRQRFETIVVSKGNNDEMARALSASRTVVHRSSQEDLDRMMFEALACGSLVLIDQQVCDGMSDLFRADEHLVAYRDTEELIDKIAFYLARDEIREKIAASGRSEVLAKHTYRHRMQTLLDAVKLGIGSYKTQVRNPRSAVAMQDGIGGHRTAGSSTGPDVLTLIPPDAKRVLDLSGNPGRSAASLKARQRAHLIAIVRNAEAATTTGEHVDQFLVGKIEESALGFAPETFDAIICGDILEYLRAPEELLRRIRDWLTPTGQVIASIRNVRHHSIVSSLLAGTWSKDSDGQLDSSPLQFLTRRNMEDLFNLAGLVVKDWQVVPGPGYELWVMQGKPGEVRAGQMQLSGLSPTVAEEFYVDRYLLAAERAKPTKPVRSSRTPQSSQSKPVPRSRPTTNGPMTFRQDFISDFDQFRFTGQPFAFARFADGERAICMNEAIVGCDGWSYAGGDSRFAAELNAALQFWAPDYYVGISDGCCDLPARDWYLDRIRVPMDQVTFSNIFVNWNYRRFRQLPLANTVTVACQGGDFTVPEDILRSNFDLDALVSKLHTIDRPILVAAGPASAIIIHKYWQQAHNKQTIVDVGSAIDERIKGGKTRPYQQLGTRQAELICRW